MNASFDVMNNNDLRRYIWCYLRKTPKISCFTCGKCCVWDSKIINKYVEYKYLQTNMKYDCKECSTDIDPYQIYFSQHT